MPIWLLHVCQLLYDWYNLTRVESPRRTKQFFLSLHRSYGRRPLRACLADSVAVGAWPVDRALPAETALMHGWPLKDLRLHLLTQPRLCPSVDQAPPESGGRMRQLRHHLPFLALQAHALHQTQTLLNPIAPACRHSISCHALV